jgi:hypothetical protein
MLFRNLTTSPGQTGCQGGQGSPRTVAPNDEEEEEEEVTDTVLFSEISVVSGFAFSSSIAWLKVLCKQLSLEVNNHTLINGLLW